MRLSRLVLVAVPVIGLVAGALLFVTPPRPFVRAVAISSADSVMDWEGTPLQRAGRKLLNGYLQTALASHIAKRVITSDESDEQVLVDIITLVQRSSLNQTQYDHIAKMRPVLLTGFGYCDQINAAVGAIAAHRFPKVQLYGLYDAKRKMSPHAIARVWSRKRGDWLYYDAFFDVPVLFTRAADGTPKFLGPYPVRPTASRGTPVFELYSMPGWELADFHPTFGGLLAARASALRTSTPAPPLDPVLNAGTPAHPVEFLAGMIGTTPAADPQAFRRVARAYMAARVDHLLTGKADAKRYRTIASQAKAAGDFRASEIGIAAEQLAELSE